MANSGQGGPRAPRGNKLARLVYIKQRLIDLMKEKQIHKQTDLADRLGVKRQSVNNWLSGKNFMDPETLTRVAKFFDVPESNIDPGEDYDPNAVPSRGYDMTPHQGDPLIQFVRVDAALPVETAAEIMRLVKANIIRRN